MNSTETSAAALVGILDDGWAGLGDAARACLQNARRIIGAARTLDLVAPHLNAEQGLQAMDGQLGRVPGWLAEAQAAGETAVVLATGDPLCHGIARFLMNKGARFRVLPAVSTLQLAFARFCLPWQEARIASVHSQDAGEWAEGATPEHGLYPLVRLLAEHPLLGVFTSPENSPNRIARALLAAGFGDEVRLSVATRLALPDESLHPRLSLHEAAAQRFAEPNVVILERTAHPAAHPIFGLEETDYVQRFPEKGLITKLEARAVSLARLGLRDTSVVWDIGAGSGSVGLEAARIARRGHVWAIEKNSADAANARENARRLQASNYTLHEGKAPAGLEHWPAPDAVFIGGSGGELEELIALILDRLRPGGRLVMNFVTLENLATATAALARAGLPWDVTQLQAARSQPILHMHRMAAQNPVWIVTVRKEPPCSPPPATDA